MKASLCRLSGNKHNSNILTKLSGQNNQKPLKMNNYLLFITVCVICFASCESKDRTYYELDEIELTPEGIAYSATTDLFYLTSIAKSKIITVDGETGTQEDFISEKEAGFMPGVGIVVDDKRGVLHALGGYYMLKGSHTALYTFDIESKKLLKKYAVVDTGDHFLNDLIQDMTGNLYITDTKASAVYFLKNGNDSLELYYQSKEIEYPNGIAISGDYTKLYVASTTKGVRVFDIPTKTILNGVDGTGISLGIDGLEYFKGSLYAIQNSYAANGDNFRKLILNKSEDEVSKVEVIDSNNPDLDVPLTFCIANDKAIVIGNSNLEHLDQISLTFPQPDSLKKTKLLIYPLKTK